MSILLAMIPELVCSLAAMLLAAGTLHVIFFAQRRSGRPGWLPTARIASILPFLKRLARLDPAPRGDRSQDPAGQLSARLEAKIAALDALVRSADARIAELARLLEQPSAAMPSPAAKSGVPPSAPRGGAPLNSASTAGEGSRTASALRHDPAQTSRPNRPAPSRADRQTLVHQLAAEGLDADQIAVATRIPKGEVQLILGLRRGQPVG